MVPLPQRCPVCRVTGPQLRRVVPARGAVGDRGQVSAHKQERARERAHPLSASSFGTGAHDTPCIPHTPWLTTPQVPYLAAPWSLPVPGACPPILTVWSTAAYALTRCCRQTRPALMTARSSSAACRLIAPPPSASPPDHVVHCRPVVRPALLAPDAAGGETLKAAHRGALPRPGQGSRGRGGAPWRGGTGQGGPRAGTGGGGGSGGRRVDGWGGVGLSC